MSEHNPINLADLSVQLDEILQEKESTEYEELQLSVCEFLDGIEHDSEESQVLILSKLLEAEIWPPGYMQHELRTLFDFFQDICSTSSSNILDVVAKSSKNDWWLYDGDLLNELIENPILPVSMLEIILEQTEWEGSFLGALRHANTPESILQKIFEEGPPEYLYEGELESLTEVFAGHKNTPLNIIEKLASNEEVQVRTAAIVNIAGREETDLVNLARYAIHEDIQIRTAAFNNPKATDEIRASAALLGVAND